jgi:hypothetical protein
VTLVDRLQAGERVSGSPAKGNSIAPGAYRKGFPDAAAAAQCPCRRPAGAWYHAAFGRQVPAVTASQGEDQAMAKTTCPISRADFHARAKPVSITIGDRQLTADVKEFSTGSFGWYLNAKATLAVGGVAVPVQINANLIIVGSKEAPGAAKAAGDSTDAAG